MRDSDLIAAIRMGRARVLNDGEGSQPWLRVITLEIDGSPGDQRVTDALTKISECFPVLGRKVLGVRSGEGYRIATKMLEDAGLLLPLATRGEKRRWNKATATPGAVSRILRNYVAQTKLRRP